MQKRGFGFHVGCNRTEPTPAEAIIVFYNQIDLDLITNDWASNCNFRAKFRYLFIQKIPLGRRVVEEKFFFIWKYNKFRTRVLIPLLRNGKIIGTELLTYFPFLFYCSNVFSAAHIVRLGYFQFNNKSSQSK